MKRQFWEIFIDEDRKPFEILGLTDDDTLLTNRTAEMLDYDIYAQCSTTPAETTRESLVSIFENKGYTYRKGLYGQLCFQLIERKARGQKKRVFERGRKN